MKGTFIALLALVAAPALGLEDTTLGKPILFSSPEMTEIAAGGSAFAGSLAGRAAAALAENELVARAQFFCQLPTSAVSGAPPNAANIDGMLARSLPVAGNQN